MCSEARRPYDDSEEVARVRIALMTPCRNVLHLPRIWGEIFSCHYTSPDTDGAGYHMQQQVQVLLVLLCSVVHGLHACTPFPAHAQFCYQRFAKPLGFAVWIRESIDEHKVPVCPSHCSPQASLDLWRLVRLLVKTLVSNH